MPKLEVDAAMVDDLEIDELIAIQEGDLKVLKGVLGRFVKDDAGKAMNPEEGAAWVGKLKLGQFKSIAEGITAQIKETVPNG